MPYGREETDLTDDDVRKIKRALWWGSSVAYLSKLFDIPEPSIYAIRNGQRRIEVPWPDGSNGAMSDPRKSLIEKMGVIDIRSEHRMKRVEALLRLHEKNERRKA
jgi:hypothetical protein